MTRPLALVFCFWMGVRLLSAADAWTHVTPETEPNLPGNEVQFLKEGADGRVWFGTLGGIGWFKDGKFNAVRDSKGKPLAIQAWDVLELAGGPTWIGHGHGAILLADGKMRHTLEGNTVAPIIRFDERTLWAIAKSLGAEKNALYERRGEDWAPQEHFRKLRVVDLFQSREGVVWLTIDGNGVFEIDPKKGADKAVHHLQGLNVTAVTQDGRDRIWCGLWGRGARVYDAGAWQTHLAREPSAVLSIQADRKGTVWVATSASGVWRFDGQNWTNDLKEEGNISLLAATPDGRVWVSSQQGPGLRFWDGQKWVVSLDSPLPIRCLIQAKDGTVWAGGVLDGLHILRGPLPPRAAGE